MRVLVCGSREWTDGARIRTEMLLLKPAVLIHGAARGADLLSVEALRGGGFAGVAVHAFPVSARLDGPWPGAGPRRNARMLRYGAPDRGLAFGPLYVRATVDGAPGWKRTGTGDMVSRMLQKRIPVRWVATPDAVAVDLAEMPRPN